MAFKKHRGVVTTPPLGSSRVKDDLSYLKIAREQLKSVKDDLGYLYISHVAQMNGYIDTDYSQRPQTF